MTQIEKVTEALAKSHCKEQYERGNRISAESPEAADWEWASLFTTENLALLSPAVPSEAQLSDEYKKAADIVNKWLSEQIGSTFDTGVIAQSIRLLLRESRQVVNDEIWWLIERKPWESMNEVGNRFFDGKDWQESALKAARFPSKEAAQAVCDNYVTGYSAFGSTQVLRGYAFPVEHLWHYPSAKATAYYEASTVKAKAECDKRVLAAQQKAIEIGIKSTEKQVAVARAEAVIAERKRIGEQLDKMLTEQRVLLPAVMLNHAQVSIHEIEHLKAGESITEGSK